MKTTITVNLNGLLFHIEEDAYRALNKYLNNIKSYFKNKSDAKEILDDIESRIAELLKERLGKIREVINLQDVEYVISIIGEPYEIGNAGSYSNYYSKRKQQWSGASRRMYRDPDNRVLGGVCSGMGAYFNVDPVVIRVIFILAFLGFCIGILIYIILWIVIPEALTPAQKCEMRGETVNLSNIGKNIKNEYENIKRNMNL